MSLPVRGAWIEIFPAGSAQRKKPSLPVRGAWIEIIDSVHSWLMQLVAPRAGSVD